MPTSSDAMVVRAGKPSKQQRRAAARASSDPANPCNDNKPLASLYDADEIDKPLYRWEEDFEIETAGSKQRFWDTQSVVAATLSFAVGTLIGIPLGHFIYASWL